MINFKILNLQACFAIVLLLTAINSYAANNEINEVAKLSANKRHLALKQALFSDPYLSLPYYKVTKALFNSGGKQPENHLLNDAKRTLASDLDLLGPERGQKLLQANGICFVGEWRIDQPSGFSGLYKLGTRAPVIARASVSFSGTKQKERRALGLAVKLLPNDLSDAPSLNIFTLHSVGGVKTKHLLDLALDNEPPLGRIPRFRDISTALKLKNVLLKADKEAGSEKPSVTFRSVAHLASYNETQVVAPRWIRFSAANNVRVDKEDFRDELRVENYPNKQLVYRIEVADEPKLKKSKAQWQDVGQLVFTDSVTSKACDMQLHFSHPKN